jgi:putative nucleotidyltransferase with HDIG domain
MINETRQRIIKKALSVDSLPILPDFAFEIMSLSENDNRSIKQISDLISKDPSVTAAILKVANSAFYGLKKNVGTLDSALIILGLREIKNIVFMMFLFKFYSQDGDYAFDKFEYIYHSILTATTAKKITQIINLEFKSSPFICGLLHDIGKIFLDQYAHQQYYKVIKEIKTKNICMFEAEQKILGIDHAEIGAIISKTWQFPDDITEAIRNHHKINGAYNENLLTPVIYISNLFTNLRKVGVAQSKKGVDIYNIPSWKFIEEKASLFKNIDVEKMIFEIDDDLKKVDEIVRLYSSKFFS